jgi:hypothetical protein
MKIAIILGVLLIVIIAILLLIKSVAKESSSKKKKKTQQKPASTPSENWDLDKLIAIAKSGSSTKEDLQKALDIFVEKYPIPAKRGLSAPAEAKKYLDFLFQFDLNPNADAKLIVEAGNRIKAANPSYSLEIEDYEKKAIAFREGLGR